MANKNCAFCGATFTPSKQVRKFCNHKCFAESRRGKKTTWGWKIGNALRGKKKTKEHIEAARKALLASEKYWASRPRGEKHAAWKGDKVGYCAVHDWVSRIIGRASYCEVCGITEEKRRCYLANLSGEYRRDISDWKKMCASCHRKHDLKNGTWATGKFTRNKSGGHSLRI